MTTIVPLDLSLLRSAIQHEYDEVASCPAKGFHFHVGRPLAAKLGYPGDWVGSLPAPVVESFAGVGNPYSWGVLATGETAVDLGSGAGFDAILAARMVGRAGRVIGIDMTPAMVAKARANAALVGLDNVEVHEG